MDVFIGEVVDQGFIEIIIQAVERDFFLAVLLKCK